MNRQKRRTGPDRHARHAAPPAGRNPPADRTTDPPQHRRHTRRGPPVRPATPPPDPGRTREKAKRNHRQTPQTPRNRHHTQQENSHCVIQATDPTRNSNAARQNAGAGPSASHRKRRRPENRAPGSNGPGRPSATGAVRYGTAAIVSPFQPRGFHRSHQVLKAMTSGKPNSDAHALALAFWIGTMLVSPVHQPLPVAMMTSRSKSMDCRTGQMMSCS